MTCRVQLSSLFPAGRLALCAPVLHARTMFPMQASSRRQPLPPNLELLVPKYCERIGLPEGLQPSSVWSDTLTCSLRSTGTSRVSHVLNASLHACHALRTPADPPASHQNDTVVWASGAFKPSPSASMPCRGCTRLQGRARSLVAYMVPCVRFV